MYRLEHGVSKRQDALGITSQGYLEVDSLWLLSKVEEGCFEVEEAELSVGVRPTRERERKERGRIRRVRLSRVIYGQVVAM